MAHPAPRAKAAILTQLQARPSLSAVRISWGGPTEEEDITEDMIWLGDIEIPEDDWSELGAQRRRMTFNVGFSIAVRRYGDDEQTTEQQAWDYYDEFVAALRTDYTLGGTVQQFAAVPARQINQPAGPQQWGSLISGQVVCTSRAY